ncbi:ABC transporter ATP-binding protein [Vineibacter terrae]|uniref:ABC transporter ATP-binding protein n=1 Tax=Vineibacter terrae TaxID=2586908 RepID=UPI002E34B58F|nr:ABC transporter ATP-binding protein [Vineibacter terrae]HEX2885066.1 ABC transporter ATP-binding protein [Vineibacter terrae]
MSYISVDRVFKIYGGRQGPVEAVSNVSFAVEAGEFVSILGPSGCGKSTLLMMLAGLEASTAGAITIDGRTVTSPRRDVGLIFQDATLLPWLSVLDNVLFPIRIMKGDLATHRQKARELLDMVGLGDFQAHKPAQLSGGMRQRVAICRALIHDPHLLLMDEPFSALDAITRDDMNMALLEIWQRYHKTGVFITHSIREAVMLSDRVLVMTRRPSTVVCDIRIPFARPRGRDLGETLEFNAICRTLREHIEAGHRQDRAA